MTHHSSDSDGEIPARDLGRALAWLVLFFSAFLVALLGGMSWVPVSFLLLVLATSMGMR